MRNIFLVIKHEIKTTLSKRSFWLTTFFFPLIIIGLSFLPQLLIDDAVQSGQGIFGAAGDGPRQIGYVDMAGVIAELPANVPADYLRAFPDEAAARSALAAGDLEQYYLIPADFMASGEVVLVESQLSLLGGAAGAELIRYLVNYNLVGDEGLASLLIDPTPAIDSRSLAPEPEAGIDEDNPLSFSVPFAVMFILFFTITMSSSYMLQSVVKEKENRTAEVLLVSLRPIELMIGKVAGLGVVALLQMVIWAGGGLLVLNRTQSVVAAAAGFNLPPGFIIWAMLYFLLGYLLYASALGALGALAPNVREGSQFTFIIILPLLIPLWLNSVFIQSPDGVLATVLSLFPLTAPTSMVTRLSVTDVPLWQPVVGLLGLAVTAYLFTLLSARFFRADTLLSSASLNWRRIVSELRG